jgi:hypothetical protein
MASGFMVASTQRRSEQLSFATPAKSAEEDLELTRKVIQGFFNDDTADVPAPTPVPASSKEETKEE